MWKWTVSFILLVVQLAFAEEVELNVDQPLKCEGMYSRSAWGGPAEPFIIAKFVKQTPGDDDPVKDPTVAIVMFEWRDRDLLGAPLQGEAANDPDLTGERVLICDHASADAGYCSQEDYGKYIVSANATRVRTVAAHLTKTNPVSLNIDRTGYYCVSTQPLDDIEYRAVVEFRNAYGELPGSQIAKLPFYGTLTIVYAVIGIFWAFLYVQNRSDILPVQNYITFTIIFLVVEMLMTWAYFDFLNRNGSTAGAKALMMVVSILNAARNSLSFFLLLLVCMGYGVVKPTLGKTMIYVRWLAVTHFAFGVLYAVGSLTIRPEDAGPLVLLVVLPLAGTGTAFYVWTLNSLGATLKDLMERKQRVKALMYRRLWWCILSSVLIIFLFFFLNVVVFTGVTTTDFTPEHWQSRWFILDGWLNLVYLADVAFIAYLWRPTANNRRFAMSDELAQDDEGFEIASVRDSMDLDDEAGLPHSGYSGAPNDSNGKGSSAERGSSPLPAPQPQRPPARMPRASLDGETIFAVGDDGDHASDEEGNDEERRGLTKKSS